MGTAGVIMIVYVALAACAVVVLIRHQRLLEARRRRFAVYGQGQSGANYRATHGEAARAALSEEFRRLASRMQGIYSESGRPPIPGVTFREGDGEGNLTVVRPGGGPERVALTFIRPRGFDGRVELSPQRIGEADIRRQGIQDFRVGDPVFDQRFLVQGEDWPSVRRLLTPQVCATILRIVGMGVRGDVWVSLNQRRLRIEKSPPILSLGPLIDFVEAGRSIFGATDAATVSPPSRCATCGGPARVPPRCDACERGRVDLVIEGDPAEELRSVIRRFASERGGPFVEGEQMIRAVFDAAGCRAHLTIVGQTGSPQRRVVLTFVPPQRFRLRAEIVPPKAPTRGPDLRIGSPDFEAPFHITGSPAHVLTAMLTPGVQEAIIRMGGAAGEIEIEVEPKRVRFDLAPAPTTIEAYRDFVGAAEAIVRRAMEVSGVKPAAPEAAAPALEFVEPGPETAPVCQVCGQGIGGGRVDCRRCKTPHHRECWDFNGKCSTYGCGERGYR